MKEFNICSQSHVCNLLLMDMLYYPGAYTHTLHASKLFSQEVAVPLSIPLVSCIFLLPEKQLLILKNNCANIQYRNDLTLISLFLSSKSGLSHPFLLVVNCSKMFDSPYYLGNTYLARLQAFSTSILGSGSMWSSGKIWVEIWPLSTFSGVHCTHDGWV